MGADHHELSNNHLTELTELTEAAINQTAINQDNQEVRADSVSNPSTTTSLSTAASGLESGGTSGSLSDSESAVVSDSSSCLAPSAVSGASYDLASSSSISAVSAVPDLLDIPDVLDNELSLSDLATAATPVSDVASVESVVATPVSDAVSVDLVLDAENLAASSASGTIPVSNSPQESSVSSVSSALTDNEKSEAAVLILADDDSNRARVLAESRINTDDTSRVNTDSASDESSLDEVRYDVSDALNDAMQAMQAMQTGDNLELSSTWDAYGASEKQDVVANVGDMTLQKSKVEFSTECLAAANRLDKHFLNALISSVQEGKTLYTDAFRITGVDRVVFSELIKFMCMEDE